MRVAIDVSHLDHPDLTGVGIYTARLMNALREIHGIELQPVFRPSRWGRRRHIMNHVDDAQPWILGGLGRSVEVLHGPDFRVSQTRKAKRVVTIHDLGFLREGMTSPEFARKKIRDLNRLLDEQTPDAIIAISKATERSLLEYRPQLEDRIHVVPLGGDHLQASGTADSSFDPSNPYFLFVGNLETRKNVLGIIRAFEQFRSQGGEARLVLIGKPGYGGDQILHAVKQSPVQAQIEVLGYCSQEELRAYYRGAVALVYPSWIEGFGIPVVEAMQLGCPVITSSVTSTAEITGDTAWLVDPADVAALREAMDQAFLLQNDASRRRDWIQRAQTQARSFTWQRCAQETTGVYSSVLNCQKVRGTF